MAENFKQNTKLVLVEYSHFKRNVENNLVQVLVVDVVAVRNSVYVAA